MSIASLRLFGCVDYGEAHGFADRVALREGDLLEPLVNEPPVDVIVSNPPYISDSEWAEVPANVKDHEPELALRSGRDGLDAIRRLIEAAPRHLAEGGWLLIECAASNAELACELMAGSDRLEAGDVLSDVEGLPRVATARRTG